MADRFLISTLLAAIEQGEPVARVVMIAGDRIGAWALVRQEDAPGWEALGAGDEVLVTARAALGRRRHITVEEGTKRYWVEVVGAPPTLLVVGAGHLAEPLATLGKLCDFRVVILDDRPHYANRSRFPQADEVIAAPFTATLQRFPFDPDTYVVLVTRGHAHDVECLIEILDRPRAYIGMVGSKRRVKAVWELLEQEKGIDRHRLQHVFAPVGLDIGAENPAEIAVSIMAEILLVRRGGTGVPLSDALRERGSRIHTARIQKDRR